jgi:hypothetical protein
LLERLADAAARIAQCKPRLAEAKELAQAVDRRLAEAKNAFDQTLARASISAVRMLTQKRNGALSGLVDAPAVREQWQQLALAGALLAQVQARAHHRAVEESFTVADVTPPAPEDKESYFATNGQVFMSKYGPNAR